jgi:uncharacterized protein (TIGR02118 family)
VIKSMTLIVRKEGMSREDFERHWRDVHAPLAKSVPGISRYIQWHIQGGHPRQEHGIGVQIDGIAEVWYDDQAALERAWASDEMQALAHDRALFIGQASTLLVSDESVK